jgi:magnesium-transporting ATPase (P-type)
VIAPSAPVLAPKRPARDAPEADAWHRLSVAEVAARLETSPDAGLSSEEAAQRLAAHGPNELEAADVIAPWQILLAQFKNVLILILLVAVGFSAVLGHVTEAVVISVIVVFAAVLGFVQETAPNGRSRRSARWRRSRWSAVKCSSAACPRDARKRLRHLLRQDRDAHEGSDDRAQDLLGRAAG